MNFLKGTMNCSDAWLCTHIYILANLFPQLYTYTEVLQLLRSCFACSGGMYDIVHECCPLKASVYNKVAIMLVAKAVISETNKKQV